MILRPPDDDKESREVKKKKYDGVLYLVLATLFVASVLGTVYPRRKGGEIVIEAVRGGEVTTLGSIGEMGGSKMTFGGQGNFNEVIIGEGVRMISADCPGGD